MSAPARVPGPAPRPTGARSHPLADPARPADGSRAVEPDATGVVERDGVRIAWDRYGAANPDPGARPTILLLPTWSIVHSRVWKSQIPFLARHFRVVVFDGRGNGRSDRPATAGAYGVSEFEADALAVMDATATSEAVLVSFSMGAHWATALAANHPDRVAGAVFIGPSMSLAPPDPSRAASGASFDDQLETYEGWDKYNRHYWLRDYPDFLEFFFAECLSEPHSTKPIEDAVGWGLETNPETLLLTEDAPGLGDRDAVVGLLRSIRCPVLVIHGSDDHVTRHAHAAALAELTGGALLTFEGSGHLLQVREPVRTNLAIRAFLASIGPEGAA